MIQSKEIEKALEELEGVDDEVFRSIGPILVKTTKSKVKKELEELKEDMDLKIKSLDRQENRLKEKMKENQERFQDLVKGHSVAG